jgi:hypothetical protein
LKSTYVRAINFRTYMDTLSLSPLPSGACKDSRKIRHIHSQGFVDEAVVSGVIARGAYERIYVKPEDMALSSSEHDYAGWALPVASPFREMQDIQVPAAVAARLPAPPTLAEEGISPEPGIEKPYAGGHRWWLFAVSGAMTCGILALTLLSLAQRMEVSEITADLMPRAQRLEVPGLEAREPAIQPTLTNTRTGLR